MLRTKTLLVSSAALAVLMSPVAAIAAEGPTSNDAEQATALEELIVTAQRRSENAQKVPISMTVLSGEEAVARFKSSNDIAQMVPNIQLDSTVGFGIPRTGIRGIAQGDFNANATTSNMIYIDDLAMDLPISQGVPLWDLDRVEVLRGPQGTLFGRNATGGAIRYISAMPTTQPKGYVELGVGAWDQRSVKAAYSGPITDSLRFRVSYVAEDFGGEIENPILRKRMGQEKYQGVRGVLEWKPNEDVTAVLRAQYFTGNKDILMWKTTPGLTTSAGNFCGPCANGYASVAAIQQAYGFQNLSQASNYRISENGTDPNEHIEHTPISLNVDWDFGPATLTSVTGYVDVKQSFLVDNDSSPAAFLDEYDKHYGSQWSQEVRLTSNNDGPFKWIAGAFYMRNFVKANLNYDATAWRGNGAANGVTYFPNSPTVLYTRGTRNNLETYAVFLHTTYEITPDLMLTAAARWTKEDKDVTYRFRSSWAFPTNVPRQYQESVDFIRAVDSGVRGALLSPADPPLSAKTSFDELTWKVGLDYRLNDRTLLYALVSRGFKGGAFTTTSNTVGGVLAPDGSVLVVKPEIVVDYEAGVKTDLIPGRLRVNGSVFYYDYKDYQTNQLFPALAAQVLSNLPKAELYGAELEVTAVPIENLTISGGLGLLHSKITKSSDPALIGNKLPLAETFNWNLLVKYDFETSIGTFSPEVSAKYKGSYYGTKENDARAKMGDYTLFNARIAYESPDGKYYGSVWGTNLADKIRPVAIDDPDEFWGSTLSFLNQHRRYGVTVGARF